MPLRRWKAHIGRLLAGALLVLVAGLASGQWEVVVLIACGGYAGWLLFNTLSLYHWLGSGRIEPPESIGIWSEIFDQINDLQRSNRRQLDQDQAIIREFQSMTNAFPDATLVLDDQDNITWFNDSASRLLVYAHPKTSANR